MSSATSQERALRHVAALASGPPVDPTLRVTLNFHPDRLLRGRLVLDALAEDGVYCSQFVTGTSNGGLTAHPGGDRWRWESRIFNGAYDQAPAHARPVYGALNFRRKPAGGSPRFGSAQFRLTAQTLPIVRTSLTTTSRHRCTARSDPTATWRRWSWILVTGAHLLRPRPCGLAVPWSGIPVSAR